MEDVDRPSVSIVIPVYRDERTIGAVVDRALTLLTEVACEGEVIVVDDGSPDESGAIAERIAARDARVRVAHHPQNRGYGAALKTGIEMSAFDWIGMVDGDNEYDVYDLKRMLMLRHYYPLVIGFRYRKLYSTLRVFVSSVYNALLRALFRTRFRDISTGLRVVHRSVLNEVTLQSNSPFFGAELAIKAMLRGFPVGEMGIQTFPRTFGSGSVLTLPNVVKTMRDMLRMRREVFSDLYLLPEGRERRGAGPGGDARTG